MKQTAILFGCALTLAATSPAVEIRNVTSNSVVFYDDFENVAITPSTANAYDGTQDADPIAKVGSWTVLEVAGATGQGVIQVTTYTNPPAAPVPFQGNRDLRVYRDSSHNGNELDAILTSTQTHNGDLVHLDMMVYIPSSSDVDARAQLSLMGSGNIYRARFRPNGAGFVDASNGSGPGGFTTSAVPYLTNTWQEWTMDYVVGASTFNFSVGGVSGSGTSVTSGDVANVQIFNGSDTPGSFFLDAPEPTSVALLALGSLMLWRARRRSRME